MPKILFVCLHRPDRSPSQRFRFEQYLDFLSENGFEYKFSFLLNQKDDKSFYTSGKYFAKAGILLKSILKRWRETSRAQRYDIVFIQRECFMLGTSLFEKRFAKKTKMIFDFDDSIWLQNVSDGNKSLRFLKNANKTRDIIGFASLVFAGNEYLASYARQFNPHVTIVPTTIDTDIYRPGENRSGTPVCIGWSGSFSTIQHFKFRIGALKKIKEKYGDRITFQVIGDASFVDQELGIKGLPWKKDSEIEDLHKIDIGIMPLPDDEWAKGKCGLKGLQYMSLAIATIMSPVGVNTDIIQNGVNGFLADSEEEWVNKLSALIESADLRTKMGDEGRKTVLDKYSIHANKHLYLQSFRTLLQHT